MAPTLMAKTTEKAQTEKTQTATSPTIDENNEVVSSEVDHSLCESSEVYTFMIVFHRNIFKLVFYVMTLLAKLVQSQNTKKR